MLPLSTCCVKGIQDACTMAWHQVLVAARDISYHLPLCRVTAGCVPPMLLRCDFVPGFLHLFDSPTCYLGNS